MKNDPPVSHRIRLRKPWTREIVRDGVSIARNDRVEMPDLEQVDLEHRPARYHVIYRRRFNRPTGLAESDAVFLEIDPFPAGAMDVQFNSESLMGSNDFHLAGRLKSQNTIEIVLPATDAFRPPTLRADIAVRIEPNP